MVEWHAMDKREKILYLFIHIFAVQQGIVWSQRKPHCNCMLECRRKNFSTQNGKLIHFNIRVSVFRYVVFIIPLLQPFVPLIIVFIVFNFHAILRCFCWRCRCRCRLFHSIWNPLPFWFCFRFFSIDDTSSSLFSRFCSFVRLFVCLCSVCNMDVTCLP